MHLVPLGQQHGVAACLVQGEQAGAVTLAVAAQWLAPGNWRVSAQFQWTGVISTQQKKPSSEAATNWPPCWQSQQRCQSEWAWNPTQTLRGFLLRSRLRCFGREVWGKLTLLLSVSRSVKLPPFLSTGTRGFGLLRCVFITVLNFVLLEVLSFGGIVNSNEQGKFLTCS